MLTAAMNERLTRVGPGTPCGELMRRYWIPIAPVAQLDENPVRKVRVLCEDLILYRTTKGGLGLIGDRCLHRLVDMQHGIPDECGLRCPYHGWLYDETGTCVDRPMESAKGEFKFKMKGYPVKELGGLVFAYLGPQPAPALPKYGAGGWRILNGRPPDVILEMPMEYELPAVGAMVGRDAKAAADTELVGDPGHCRPEGGDRLGRGLRGEVDDGNVFAFRNHQHMDRRLGMDVVEGEHVLVFIDLRARRLAAQDFGEDVVAVVRD